MSFLYTYPRKCWWPLLQRKSWRAQKLANAGDTPALLLPLKEGWSRVINGIPGDLWAFMLVFHYELLILSVRTIVSGKSTISMNCESNKALGYEDWSAARKLICLPTHVNANTSNKGSVSRKLQVFFRLFFLLKTFPLSLNCLPPPFYVPINGKSRK